MTIVASPAAFSLARALAVAAFSAGLFLSPMAAQPQTGPAPAQPQATLRGPLVIAKQSFFYIGGHYDEARPDRHVIGQMYVEYQVPENLKHPFPIVMVHGGTATELYGPGRRMGVKVGRSTFYARVMPSMSWIR